MSTQPKRRIQVASFTVADVSKTHVFTLILGACLVVGAMASAWMASITIQSASKSKVAAQFMKAAAVQAAQGAQNYGSGGAVKLAEATTLGLAANSIFLELSSNPLEKILGLEYPFTPAATAWSSFGGALSELRPSISAASELSETIGASAGNLVQLVKAIEATGKSESIFKKEYESALRLNIYSETGFGAASVRRVDYDLRVVAAGLGSSELKNNVAFITPLISTSKAANEKQITKDQLTHLSESAFMAKNAADALGSSVARSMTGPILMFGSVALVISGVGLTWFALLRILSDVGRRYHRSIQQFRVGEGDRKELVEQLTLAAIGRTNDIELANTASEFLDIATRVNSLIHFHTDRLGEVRSAVLQASDDHTSAVSLIESTETVLHLAIKGLDEAMSQLSYATEISHLVRLDAQAASFAAQEAGNHSSDANRMSQDATSRLDALREGLQETSKGIKRLGERTQEIDAVLDSMEMLSSQIGVLAVNANLEAERAGEAGSGFRVVAREVQTLARKSEESLERMSTLIKGAQADARSASESIERSTLQVISGSNISAVSQALLITLAPLSNGVSAISRSISDAGKDSEVSLSNTLGGLRHALKLTRDALTKANQSILPMANIKSRLEVAAITE